MIQCSARRGGRGLRLLAVTVAVILQESAFGTVALALAGSLYTLRVHCLLSRHSLAVTRTGPAESPLLVANLKPASAGDCDGRLGTVTVGRPHGDRSYHRSIMA